MSNQILRWPVASSQDVWNTHSAICLPCCEKADGRTPRESNDAFASGPGWGPNQQPAPTWRPCGKATLEGDPSCPEASSGNAVWNKDIRSAQESCPKCTFLSKTNHISWFGFLNLVMVYYTAEYNQNIWSKYFQLHNDPSTWLKLPQRLLLIHERFF